MKSSGRHSSFELLCVMKDLRGKKRQEKGKLRLQTSIKVVKFPDMLIADTSSPTHMLKVWICVDKCSRSLFTKKGGINFISQFVRASWNSLS